MKKTVVVLAVLILGLCASCAYMSKVPQGVENQFAIKNTVNAPVWVTNMLMWETTHPDAIWVVGVSDPVNTLALQGQALEVAHERAMKKCNPEGRLIQCDSFTEAIYKDEGQTRFVQYVVRVLYRSEKPVAPKAK